jgi:hypothetical protein
MANLGARSANCSGNTGARRKHPMSEHYRWTGSGHAWCAANAASPVPDARPNWTEQPPTESLTGKAWR